MAKIDLRATRATKIDKRTNSLEGVTHIYAREEGECNGYHECEHIHRDVDKDTGVDTVMYFFAGALVVEAFTAYEIKKAAGAFSY